MSCVFGTTAPKNIQSQALDKKVHRSNPPLRRERPIAVRARDKLVCQLPERAARGATFAAFVFDETETRDTIPWRIVSARDLYMSRPLRPHLVLGDEYTTRCCRSLWVLR